MIWVLTDNPEWFQTDKHVKFPKEINWYWTDIQRESFRFLRFFTQAGRQPKLLLLCLRFWLSCRLGKKTEKSKRPTLYFLSIFGLLFTVKHVLLMFLSSTGSPGAKISAKYFKRTIPQGKPTCPLKSYHCKFFKWLSESGNKVKTSPSIIARMTSF